MSHPVSAQLMFDDFASMSTADWLPVTLQELSETHGIDLPSPPVSTDLAVSHVSPTMTAVRYAWTLPGHVRVFEVRVFIFGDDETCVERTYRVRAVEWV